MEGSIDIEMYFQVETYIWMDWEGNEYRDLEDMSINLSNCSSMG